VSSTSSWGCSFFSLHSSWKRGAAACGLLGTSSQPD
jgi:hypothetical protein